MLLRYRISMPGIKAFSRLYAVDASTTLYEFHKKLRGDMELPQDQLIQFKSLDTGGALVARYGLFDLGWGAVDAVTLADTVERGVAVFVYFYNVAERKSVTITLESVDEEAVPAEQVALLETKGPNPAEIENNPAAFAEAPEDRIKFVKSLKETVVSSGADEDADDDDLDDIDDDDFDDEPEDDGDEDGQEIFDGSEELSF